MLALPPLQTIPPCRLQTRVDVAEGETVLSVPLSLGLSIASFRAGAACGACAGRVVERWGGGEVEAGRREECFSVSDWAP